MDDDALDAAELFELAPEGELDPRVIVERLVEEDDDHAHLKQADAGILVLMRVEQRVNQGKVELGSMHLPVWQGKLGPLARWLLAKVCDGLPDFIMILDDTFWRQATPLQRTALVDHELRHAAVARNKDGEERFTEEGDPVWAIAPHDLEEFNAIVQKYGPYLPDIHAFLRAAGMGPPK